MFNIQCLTILIFKAFYDFIFRMICALYMLRFYIQSAFDARSDFFPCLTCYFNARNQPHVFGPYR